MTEPVVVVGSINVDHTVVLDRFPRPGETLLAQSLTHSIGGKGANQAVAAAKAGADVAMIGMVGDDPEGESALHALARANIECGAIRRLESVPTGSAWITVATGDNTIVVVPGANHHWPEEGPSLAAASVVLCQLEIPLPVVEAASAIAGTFVLNAAPSQSLSDALLSRCDVLIVNEHELAEVADHERFDRAGTAAVVAAARSLIGRGATAVATTLGDRGAVLCTAQEAMLAQAPAVDAIDTSGAGDAFCGVFAARLAGGAGFADALRFAVAAGSLSVQRATAQGSYDDFVDLTDAVDLVPDVTLLPAG